MTVTVRLFSHFVKYLPAEAERDTWCASLADGTTVADLLARLQLPSDVDREITINDQNRTEDVVLRQDDVLKVFPVAMGG
jgi:sulfur carrier protein ThiS